jgi:hypothetical protein
MSKRIGPSMSTEPGWIAATGVGLLATWEASPAAAVNDASMLLSFERPASAGIREGAQALAARGAGRRSRLSTVLENCTEATSAAIDKRRLKTGITGSGAIEVLHQEHGAHAGSDHRQDSKGTRWMPWHQESKKGVNGCDKPRLGA